MSSSSVNIDLENARIADTDYLTGRAMIKGNHILSIITPPIYIGFYLFRKRSSHITVNRVLRATWLGGLAGVGGGGAIEYFRSANSSAETLRSRRIRAALDRASHRGDDHATIGALLGAVLTPAIFWKRGAVINLVFGGAGLGTAAGYFTHLTRSAFGDVPPTPVVPHVTSDSES